MNTHKLQYKFINDKAIKRVIKNLKDHAKDIKGIGCTFFACEGYEAGIIKSMITCDRCRSIIICEREAARLIKFLTSKNPKE